jgi:hypothetical protein
MLAIISGTVAWLGRRRQSTGSTGCRGVDRAVRSSRRGRAIRRTTQPCWRGSTRRWWTCYRAHELFVGPLTPEERDRYCAEDGDGAATRHPAGVDAGVGGGLRRYLDGQFAAGVIAPSPRRGASAGDRRAEDAALGAAGRPLVAADGGVVAARRSGKHAGSAGRGARAGAGVLAGGSGGRSRDASSLASVALGARRCGVWGRMNRRYANLSGGVAPDGRASEG